MKKLMMLFLLVSFMCFGEDKVESKKSYEVVQREEIDFLKTQLIKSNNKIDDLSKKIEVLENKGKKNLGLTYNVDQIYQNSINYYDRALEETKWLIKIVGGIISALLILFTALISIFKFNSDKKLKEERKEIKDDAKDLKKEIKENLKEEKEVIIKEVDKRMERMLTENKELKEKIAEQEKEVKRKSLELDEKVKQTTKEMNEKLKEVEYNTELAIAINKSKNEEKIEELKKLTEKYPKKSQIYYQLGSCLTLEKNFKEAILTFNKLKILEPEENRGYSCAGFVYELLGDKENKEKNHIDTKKHFEEAIKNYKEAIKLNPNNDDSKLSKKRIEGIEEKLKELEEKE